MPNIYLRDIINIDDPSSAFLSFLNNAEKDNINIYHIADKKLKLRNKILEAILNSLGVDIIEYILNLNNPNLAMAYLQILESSQNLFSIKREILRFNNLSNIQKILLEEHASLLKEGVSKYIRLEGKDDQHLQSLHKGLFKYYTSKIIKFLIKYLWQVKNIKPEEVQRIKSEIREPCISSEVKTDLSQSMLEATFREHDAYGYPVLISAIKSNCYKTVRMLIKHGVIEDSTELQRNLALITAILNNNVKIVELLLENGVNANFRHSEHNITPLMYAVSQNIKIAELLIRYKVPLDTQDNREETALIKAVEGGYNKIVGLLLRNGANTEIESIDGKTASIIAVRKGAIKIIRLLLEAGAEHNKINLNGRSALLEAIRGNI